jgi:4,5-dihydroxyphthalate decarboxylase
MVCSKYHGAMTTLSAVTRTQGNSRAVKDGTVKPAGYQLAFQEVPVLVTAFRRMVRELEFDVCEMALTTYLCAREHGVRFTALPVFLVRGFHHGAVVVNRRSGVTSPKDLEGRRVGVNRGYTVTTGVWARGILADEYDVRLDEVTWVRSGDEHVEAYVPPPNVVAARPGKDLASMLVDGDVDAVVGALDVDHPDVVPLLDDPEEAGFAALAGRRHYPINHLIVVRDDVLERHPDATRAIYDAFERSKDMYVDELLSGSLAEQTDADRMHLRVMDVAGGDPLPYGLAPNRSVLEELVRHAVDQHILSGPVELDSMFALDA